MAAPIMDGGINWSRANRESFERAIESILTRYHEDRGAKVVCPDGKGGDGGVDLLVEYPHKIIVYQLKYFPEGISTPSRKKQIQESFNRAMKTTSPKEWWLCIPSKLTRAQRQFVMDLPGDRDVVIRILDRPRIDALLLKYPDVLGWLSNDDYVTQQAKLFRTEESVLSGGFGDLDQRVANLQLASSALDPDWDVSFTTNSVGRTYLVQPKHSHSQERSPIRPVVEFDGSSLGESLRGHIDDQRAYGTRSPVTVPRSVIKRLSWEGPKWLVNSVPALNELTFHGPDSQPSIPGRKVKLKFQNQSGQIIAEREGVAAHGAFGGTGVSLEATFYEALTITCKLPTQNPAPASIQTSIDLANRTADTARRVSEIMILLSGGHDLTLYIDGHDLFRASQMSGPEDEQLMYKAMAELADDLQVIEARTGVDIPFPNSFSNHDRIETRCLRLMLDGKQTYSPKVEFSATPNPDFNPRDFQEERQILVTRSGFVQIFGREVPAPTMVCWVGRASARGLDLTMNDLAAHQSPRSFQMVPAKDEYILMWMPERCAIDNDDPVPWGLTGITGPGSTPINLKNTELD